MFYSGVPFYLNCDYKRGYIGLVLKASDFINRLIWRRVGGSIKYLKILTSAVDTSTNPIPLFTTLFTGFTVKTYPLSYCHIGAEKYCLMGLKFVNSTFTNRVFFPFYGFPSSTYSHLLYIAQLTLIKVTLFSSLEIRNRLL